MKTSIMSRKAISEPSHSLDRERGFLGLVKARKAGQVGQIDWNRLLLGKKVISEQEVADADVEAPRNSLESSPGTRTPRLGGVRHEEIPYSYEIPKPTPHHHGRSGEMYFSRTGELVRPKGSPAEVLAIKTLIAQDSSDAEHEKKRRSAPSVVARLMGLDTLPDKLSRGSPTKPPKTSKSSHGSRKDTRPHSARAETCSRPPSPLHDVEIIKDFPLPKSRATTDGDICDDRMKFDALPFRAHPQERQLQEFKKEFMEKLANQRYGSTPGAAGAGDQLREFGAKKEFMEKLANQRYGSTPGAAGAGDQLREFGAKKEFMEKLANQRYGSTPGAAGAGDQLREFGAKKDFMEKLANQRYGSTPGAGGAGDQLREVSAKRRLLREKLSEAKQAMSSGGDEPRRLSSAQEKLMESKEFQDAIELLQTNKEFFKKFFPGSTIPSYGGNKDPPEPECPSRKSFHLGDSYAEPVRHDETSRRSFHLGDFSRESRMTSLLEEPTKESSRRSFHLDDLTECGISFYEHPQVSPRESSERRSFNLDEHSSRDFRRSHRHVEDVTKEIRALEDYSDLRHGDHHTGSHGRASSEHRKRRETRRKSPGPNPVAEDVVILQKSSSRVSNKDRELISWATPDHNNGRYGSPDTRKGCDSPSRIVVLKPGPGEITLLTTSMDPSRSPHSYRVVRDSRGDPFEAHEVILLDPKERFCPSTMEEPRHSREEYRDPRVDPRAIARDIVREARTNSTRELSRDRETGRESPRPGHVSLTRLNGSSGAKRVSLPKYGHAFTENMEERISETDETMSSLALASLSRRHAMEEKSRCASPTAPLPSPRNRSQEAPLTPDRFPSHKEGKLRKLPEKSKTVYHVEQREELHRNGGLTEVRITMGQAHELNRAPMITRPRQVLPVLKSPARKTRADPFQESHIRADGLNSADLNMHSTLPSTERVLKVESMYPSNHHQNGGNESQENSPRTILRMRSFPNAGAMVGAKIRNAEVPSRIGSHVQERMESSEHFYLREKRAEARQPFLLSRKKIVGIDTSTSGRSVSHQPRPVDNNAVQDIYVNNMSLGAVQQLNRSVVTRPSFEKAIPVEDLPRQGAGEHDLAGAFSQRTPKTPPGAKDNSETDELRQCSSRKQLEVPVKQQGSKSSKAWSIATETIENGDGDGASETSVDKCGQPSPVSVLDSPFEAEISSPVEFKELNSDIQDLRLRLRLLKLDSSERSTVLSESVQAKEMLNPPNQVVRHIENSLECTESIGSSFNSTNFSIYREFEPHTLQSQALLFQTDNIDIQGLHCPAGRRGELLYVRNILVASGLSDSGPKMVEKWYSPTCPLDPTVYEKLEESYLQADLQVISEHGNTKNKLCQQGNLDSSSRRLLFDVVNEVLLQLISPYLTFEPWIRPPTATLRPIPTNWQLFSATWLEICSYFYPEGVEEFEALDCLMSRDVSKRAPWVDCLASYEQMGLELERNIFESLIEETVLSYALQ